MAAAVPVTYQVTAISPDRQLNGQSDVVPGKRVTFKTSTGYEGTVFIPDSVFSDMNVVRQLVEAEAMLIAQAQQIAGTVTAG